MTVRAGVNWDACIVGAAWGAGFVQLYVLFVCVEVGWRVMQ